MLNYLNLTTPLLGIAGKIGIFNPDSTILALIIIAISSVCLLRVTIHSLLNTRIQSPNMERLPRRTERSNTDELTRRIRGQYSHDLINGNFLSIPRDYLSRDYPINSTIYDQPHLLPLLHY